MAQKADKNEARDILECITTRNLTGFAHLSRREFADGVMSNWGCSRATANLVTKMTGNW